MQNLRLQMENARATSSHSPQEAPIFSQFNSVSTTDKLLQEHMPRFGASADRISVSESPLANAVSADAIPTPQGATSNGPSFEEVRAAHTAASETVKEIAQRCTDPTNLMPPEISQRWQEECFALAVQNFCLQQELMKKPTVAKNVMNSTNATTNRGGIGMNVGDAHSGSGSEATKVLAALRMQQSSLMSVLHEFDKKCKVRLDSVSHRTRRLEENVQTTMGSLNLAKSSSTTDVADLVREAVWRQREASLAMEKAATTREEELYRLFISVAKRSWQNQK